MKFKKAETVEELLMNIENREYLCEATYLKNDMDFIKLKELVKKLTIPIVVKSLKDKETMTFERFKNKYFIDKSLKTDPFGFTKDLTEEQLIDKYALYLKQNL